jgi:2-polyprenylphenol 6-hydroxylase
MEPREVIVVGGGVVGATMACALGHAGIAVTLIEAHAPASVPVPRDPRMFAITRASERIFRSLQVWDAMVAQDHCAFTDMEVWDSVANGCLHFDCAELAEPCLGYIFEPRIMTGALEHRLRELPSVRLLQPSRCVAIRAEIDSVYLTLQDGQVLQSGLVVAADGADSPLRRMLGMTVQAEDYHQTSVVALVQTAQSHRNTAWQRFLPGGPLAFLPLADGWSAIVWTLPTGAAERILALDATTFHAELGAAFELRLGEILDSGPRAAWPLRRQHADHYISARVVLVGDAAHVIHPLAGQGVNLGLLDVAVLAGVIAAARARGRDPGDRVILRRFERWRRGDNLLMMSAMHGINRLFSNSNPALGRLRSGGLDLVNHAAPLRKLLMRHAMGLDGDLPALARTGSLPKGMY